MVILLVILKNFISFSMKIINSLNFTINYLLNKFFETKKIKLIFII
jgi:hypothetical protein